MTLVFSPGYDNFNPRTDSWRELNHSIDNLLQAEED